MLFRSITPDDAADPAEATRPATGDPGRLRDLLIRLRPLLQKRQPRPSQAVMAEIDGTVWPRPLLPHLETLGRRIGKYQFKEALAILEALLETLETPGRP